MITEPKLATLEYRELLPSRLLKIAPRELTWNGISRKMIFTGMIKKHLKGDSRSIRKDIIEG
jgi:hypothetical protein